MNTLSLCSRGKKSIVVAAAGEREREIMLSLHLSSRKAFLASRMSSQLIYCYMCSTSQSPTPPPPSKKKKKQSTIDSIKIKESDIVESFIKGRGPGGQSINKSASRVRLSHVPSGIAVAVQETRDLTSNRKIARKLLKEKLDFMLHGEESKLGLRIAKMQKKKSKSASRAAKKYDNKKPATVLDEEEGSSSSSSSSDSGESSSDESDGEDEEDNLK